MINISKILEEIRVKNNLTYEKLGAIIGKDKGYVHRTCNGKISTSKDVREILKRLIDTGYVIELTSNEIDLNKLLDDKLELVYLGKVAEAQA